MPASPNDEIVAQLMGAFRRGNHEAGRELADLFYPQLRRLAASKMKGERSEHTWQPTALVHELYLELVKVRALGARNYDDQEEERAAFLRLAGHMMKRLLIHHARPLYRRAERVEISDPAVASPEALHEVEDALSRLAAVDPELRRVVEMKVFEGLTRDEIAQQLGCSRRTVAGHWSFARHWLQKEWAGKPLS